VVSEEISDPEENRGMNQQTRQRFPEG